MSDIDSTAPRQRNDEMNLAWQLLSSTDMSVFLTGNAGTGKTTFLRRLRELSPKRMVVLAPTGVAAINAQGQTIHSFFQLPFGPIVPGTTTGANKSYRMGKEKKNIIRTLDLLVIDEISMVRCDLLDAVDAELRKYRDRYKPFGGVQLLLIGDLQQLAPVAKPSEWKLLSDHYATPYFFDSKALKQTKYVTVELKHIYRQQDPVFIDILARIRANRVDAATLSMLNSRCHPGFAPVDGEEWIRLTTHNNMADSYNHRRLDSLKGKEWEYTAKVKGNFPESTYPADATLTLKEGAQVMFIKNDPSGMHDYYNGKIGVVTALSANGVQVYSKSDGTTVTVGPVEWQNTRYVLDDTTKEIKEEIDGVFAQMPLRLAWAITVHKSQGLTFDRAVLDINASFAHGQAYVALSRCRSLQGMVLESPLDARAVITDTRVNEFISTETSQAMHVREDLPRMMSAYFISQLDDLFDFSTLYSDLAYVQRIVAEHLYRQQPDLLGTIEKALPAILTEIGEVSSKFSMQYRAMAATSANPARDPAIQERVKAAAKYFIGRLSTLVDPLKDKLNIAIGNKQTLKQYTLATDNFLLSLRLKTGTLPHVAEDGFTVKRYLEDKARAALSETTNKETPKKKAKDVDDIISTESDLAWKPWTDDQEATLRKLRATGMSPKAIGKRMGRSPGAIRSRLKKLGID